MKMRIHGVEWEKLSLQEKIQVLREMREEVVRDRQLVEELIDDAVKGKKEALRIVALLEAELKEKKARN